MINPYIYNLTKASPAISPYIYPPLSLQITKWPSVSTIPTCPVIKSPHTSRYWGSYQPLSTGYIIALSISKWSVYLLLNKYEKLWDEIGSSGDIFWCIFMCKHLRCVCVCIYVYLCKVRLLLITVINIIIAQMTSVYCWSGYGHFNVITGLAWIPAFTMTHQYVDNHIDLFVKF